MIAAHYGTIATPDTCALDRLRKAEGEDVRHEVEGSTPAALSLDLALARAGYRRLRVLFAIPEDA